MQTRTKQDVNKSETRMQITEQGHKHEPGQITKEKIWIGQNLYQEPKL